jgi:hypothetical protein
MNSSQIDVISRGYIEHGLAGASLYQWVLARCSGLTTRDIWVWLQTKRWTKEQLERRALVIEQQRSVENARRKATQQARDILAHEIWLAKQEASFAPPYKGSWGWE